MSYLSLFHSWLNTLFFALFYFSLPHNLPLFYLNLSLLRSRLHFPTVLPALCSSLISSSLSPSFSCSLWKLVFSPGKLLKQTAAAQGQVAHDGTVLSNITDMKLPTVLNFRMHLSNLCIKGSRGQHPNLYQLAHRWTQQQLGVRQVKELCTFLTQWSADNHTAGGWASAHEALIS